jgi:hypothetical protein
VSGSVICGGKDVSGVVIPGVVSIGIVVGSGRVVVMSVVSLVTVDGGSVGGSVGAATRNVTF